MVVVKKSPYRISGIFNMGLIFAEFATSLKLPKIDTVKNKPYYMSSLRVLEIAKIELSENQNQTHFPSCIFVKISQREKFPIYGMFKLCHLYNSGGCTGMMYLWGLTVDTETSIMLIIRYITITNCPFSFAFSHLPRCGQLLRQKHRHNFT